MGPYFDPKMLQPPVAIAWCTVSHADWTLRPDTSSLADDRPLTPLRAAPVVAMLPRVFRSSYVKGSVITLGVYLIVREYLVHIAWRLPCSDEGETLDLLSRGLARYQYHCCWCIGPLRPQGIGNNCISKCVPIIPRGRQFHHLYHISVRNDRNWKTYVYV